MLTILGSTGFYVYTRIDQALSGLSYNSGILLLIYLFLMLSWFIGKAFEAYSVSKLSNALIKIGSIGIGFFLYAFLLVVFIDIIRLVNYIIPFYPSFITLDFQKTKLVTGIISLLIISIAYILGYINARTPIITNLNIDIDKNQASLSGLNIVAVSDIHLGTSVNKSKTRRLINTINNLKPDLVIIGGDIIDDNIKVVKHYKLLEHFKEINSKYGVYSCLGNHEYISRAYKDLDSFENNGIKMLRDKTIKVDDLFYIIGRDDIESNSVVGKKRKSLNELSEGIDFSLPVFLIDHQPYKLHETAKFAIDFQFSGHTHSGQLWPFSLITKRIFEKDWGYLKKNNTHYYVSSGYGTSMMPIRIGTKSEIVNIRINNQE